MKYSYSAIALMAFAGLAAAQIPECGRKCIDDAVAAKTTCVVGDTACQCQDANKAAIQAAASSCVLAACGAQAIDVLNAANAACANLGKPTTAAATSAKQTTAASSAAQSTPATSAGSSAAATTTKKPIQSAATNGTATSTSARVEFSGAANNLAAGVGSVFAVGMAVLAAF